MREKHGFQLYCQLNQRRGVILMVIFTMGTSRQSKSTIKVFAPSVGKRFNFYLKNR